MAPVDLLFVSLVLLPGEVLWDRVAIDHSATAEAVSGDHGVGEVKDVLAVDSGPDSASSSTLNASEG